VQFNMACAGLPSMPDVIPPGLPERIRHEMAARGLTMAAVSGTCNMIHPDLEQRQAGLRRLEVLAAACRPMGTSLITLCTGTRDPIDQWRFHPENASAAAWHDLRASMDVALRLAADHDLLLGIEPEVSNVVDSPAKARRLLDELGSPRVKIVFDAANLLTRANLPDQQWVLAEAFDLLAPDVVLAHAKDLGAQGEAGTVAAGQGLLEYGHYLALLRRGGFEGPLLLHSLPEREVGRAIAFLQARVT
jgi:sugar phosphate isomerase/epimerase